jgi:hypothetical protein
MKGHVVEGGQIASVLVIADHQGHLTGQLSHLMAIEKINQAMLIMRNEDGDAGMPLAHHDLPGKSKFVRQRRKGARKRLLVKIEAAQRPLDTHEEHPQYRILVLIGMQNIAAMFKDELGDAQD